MTTHSMTASHFEKKTAEIDDYFKSNIQRVDEWLDCLLPSEHMPPALIHEAMRYSIFAGGKRLRPILTKTAGRISM